MVHLARGVGVGVAAATALLCGSGVAGAAGPSTIWRLTWERGPRAQTCIGDQALQRRVRQRLGRDPFAVGGASGVHTLTGGIRRGSEPEAWRISFQILDEKQSVRGQRQIVTRSPSCRKLDLAIALIAAIAVDTGNLEAPPTEAPKPEPKPVPVPVPKPEPVPKPKTETKPEPEPVSRQRVAPAGQRVAQVNRPAARLRLSTRVRPAPKQDRGAIWSPSLAAGGALDLGTLPGAALGAALELGAGIPRAVPLTLGASFWPHSEVDVAGGSASFRLIAVAVGVRPTLRLVHRLRLVLAARLELGWLQGQGHGFDRDLDSTHTLLNLGAEAGLQLRLGRRLHAAVGLGICGVLLREPFYIDDLAEGSLRVHRPAAVSLRANLSLGLAL